MSESFVSALNHLSSAAMANLWRASWQGAILITLVWTVSMAWKRMPNGLRCAIWVMVSLRLLVSLGSAGIAIPVLPANKPAAARMIPAEPSSVAIQAIELIPISVKSNLALTDPRSGRMPISTTTWFALAWILGAATVVGLALRKVSETRRILRRAVACTDRQLLTDLFTIGQTLKLRHTPKLVVSTEITDVLTFGLMRPTILMSSQTLERCSPKEHLMILAHEMGHIRRADGSLGLILQLTQALFFFHPLVWLACREFVICREAACDELAITSLAIGPDAYGRLLLKLGTRQRTAGTICTPGVSSQFQLLRRRISMLQHSVHVSPTRKIRHSLVLVGLAGALIIAPISLVQGQAPSAPAAKIKFKKMESAKSTGNSVRATKRSTHKPEARKVKTTRAEAKPIKYELADNSSIAVVIPKPTIKVFHLRFASPTRAASILREVLTVGKESRAKIASDPATNSLVVSADALIMEQISHVIRELDQPVTDNTTTPAIPAAREVVRVYQLKYSNAEEIKMIMRSTLGNRRESAPNVASDMRTNSLIVTGVPSAQEDVANLLRELDRASSNTNPFDRESGKVNKLYRIPKDAFSPFANRAGAITHTRVDTVSYGGDDNFFIVRGTPDELKKVDLLESELRHTK